MAEAKQMLSGRIYTELREAILRGDFAPGAALKPQELAGAHGVSLAVVREALVRLVGDGLADRLTNRGFAVPERSDQRWQDVAEARRTLEPATLRLAIARGDLDWEARVRAAHHRLARTPALDPAGAPGGEVHGKTIGPGGKAGGPGGEASGKGVGEATRVNPEWSRAHRDFHRTLLEGCGNAVLLATFDRLWLASELVRAWAAGRAPDRDHVGEHRRLEEATLARDADTAAALLERHLSLTAASLR
ncbi:MULTISPECIES: GntR family transcriptional regulator [Catenuloplanes]|uniref:DNA-binding GntR family transcriptional regulator n=1 Tax=Catenuloplanes niger TaxID=587534 RepID=A0AAE3ZJK6_9ACTN|nr:GntR family transcriptional regulator [Catenuloplanes niger]MDR7321093.1 DNA-binding GntR family transcriptional regulator [Catenuloplanes niger]